MRAEQWERINRLLDRVPAAPLHWLDAELGAAGRSTSILHFRLLESLGVSRETVCDIMRHDYGFGVQRVTAADDGLYVPGNGEMHLILPVRDNGELVDLCAMRSADPAGWLLRTGYGWALGLERGLEPHSWGDPVPVWLTPLSWLRAGCAGLVVLDWDAPEVRYLAGLPNLVCETAAQASRLREALTVPVRLPQISTMETRLAA